MTTRILKTCVASFATMLIFGPMPLAVAADALEPFSWTGMYVGANAGFGWGNADIDISPNPSPAAFGGPPFSYDVDPEGLLGGLQIGYNHQLDDIVLGIEADFQFSGLNDTGIEAGLPINGGGFQPISRSETASSLDNFATLRARLGYTPEERFMVYATGGLIVGSFDNDSFTQYGNTVFNPTFRYEGSSNSTRLGFVVGGGLEYAIDQSWTVKGEYLYYDLGSVKYAGPPLAPNAPFSVDYKAALTGNIVRVGVNYKF